MNNEVNKLRIRLLELSKGAKALHIAPAFSCIDLIYSIYNVLMPKYKHFDFIVSKGHGYLAQLVVLEQLNIVDSKILSEIGENGSYFGGHPDRGQPGIVASTGSLGHGLGIALGLSLGKKVLKKESALTVALISDGELQEGSTWENIINGPALKTQNLLLVVDFNNMQTVGITSETHSNLIPIAPKLEALGWKAIEIDGHDLNQIGNTLDKLDLDFGCIAIIARTTKGKGVSFMESTPIWHYRSPSQSELNAAIKELETGTP